VSAEGSAGQGHQAPGGKKRGLRRISTFYYPDAHLMPGGEHGDFVYELTRSDWTAQVKSKS
jgi:hypothetical protein